MLALAVSRLQVHVEGGESEDDLRLVAVHLRLAALAGLHGAVCGLALDFRKSLRVCDERKTKSRIWPVHG